jgi:hypothetical protein
MKTEEIKLSQITENAGNPRTITEEKFKKLVKSLLVFPRMLSLRPIVVDSQMNVLGGNMRTRALCHIVSMTSENIKDVLDTDQRLTDSEKRLIARYWSLWKEQPTATVVMASDLTEAQKKEFIIKDNVGFGDWDANMLANDWDTDALKDWGMEDWQLEGKNPAEEENGGADDNSDNNYERKIVAPIYEPQDGDISIGDCYDTSKTDSLISAIEDSPDLDEPTKAFLKVAAYRHVKFNYEKVADFYAKAPEEVQKFMEDSALVIVDIDKAIEDGFVKISKDFMEQYGKEHGNDAE